MRQPKYLSALLVGTALMGPLGAIAYDDPVRSNEPVQMTDKDSDAAKLSTGQGRSDSKSKAGFVDDRDISDNVKKALGRDPQVSGQDVKVDVHNGLVTVSGKVNDERFKGRIIQVVQGVKGVRAVKNELKLGTP
ncbi:uncharacterized protein NMK_2654 [Novimethylophilus kurashikiensis]|uniref:BON domain-containing protein n=1 Tax=Novimethylophilus kurashikiensis TaxID=1825523 RepID=A0A2R5FE45_9PROT|nr:BON domain-containing protein [Novimethylophilus kurashikiensis]GBG15053.1 uncharacterized protein NMK_2654 [Novimethylophilus kurashikiensis]